MAKTPHDYIEQYIIPAFQGIVYQDFLTTIYDIEGNIVLTSQKLAQALGFESWESMRNVNFNKLEPQQLNEQQLDQESQHKIATMFAIRDKLSTVRDIVVKEKIPISVILIHPFNKLFKNFLLLTFSPLFSPDGDVIAIYGVTSDYSMFGMMELRDILGSIHKTRINTAVMPKSLPFKLTIRQHEILFLLVLGATQEVIAELLNVTRGCVSKTITQSLLPKFNLEGAPVKDLVDICRKKNLQYLIPRSLCQPRLIVLNREITKKYDL